MKFEFDRKEMKKLLIVTFVIALYIFAVIFNFIPSEVASFIAIITLLLIIWDKTTKIEVKQNEVARELYQYLLMKK